jgi:hypothetical protein
MSKGPKLHLESLNESKRWAERLFLANSVFWIAAMAYVVATSAYERFDAMGYLLFCGALCLPLVVVPLLFPSKADRALPWTQRYW